jgi:pyridoxal/pyridoxine/pyridoxamine kinase
MILNSSKLFSLIEVLEAFFSCRQLIGKQIDCIHNENEEDIIWQSFRSLHNMGPSHIIISSISADKTGGNQTNLQMRASSKLASRIDFINRFVFDLF